MTAILAVSHNYALINIFAVVVITAAGVASAAALRKPRDRPGRDAPAGVTRLR
jgi:hypothetical protein